MSVDTDIYTLTAPEAFENFCVDDLLDLSNDDIFSSSTTDANIHAPPLHISTPTTTDRGTNVGFSHDFFIPDDDAAELEWLSNFIDESSSSFPHTSFATTTTTTFTSTGLIPAKPRTKRSKPTHTHTHTHIHHHIGRVNSYSSSNSHPPAVAGMRKCTHCASEQTPQWRTGPLGPKTLCNACGVRYKSGRLVPEYRPAASPTFVLSRHSNSHRKVMELRRQKEEVVEEEEDNNNNSRRCHVLHRHGHDYKIW